MDINKEIEKIATYLDTEEERKFVDADEEIRHELKRELKELVTWARGRERKLPATLSRQECHALMTVFKKGRLAFRNNLIIRTLYATGMRVEELSNLKFCDINYDSQTIFIRSGKGNKDRYCCVDKGTLELLRKWQDDKGYGDAVFGVSKRQIRKIVEEAGTMTGVSQKFDAMGRVFSCHSLRHSFATHSFENGMRVPTLRMLLGHEHLGTTMIYLYTAKKYDVLEYNRTNPIEVNSFIILPVPLEEVDTPEKVYRVLHNLPLTKEQRDVYEVRLSLLCADEDLGEPGGRSLRKGKKKRAGDEKEEMAEKLLKKGYPLEEISEITGLSETELRKVQFFKGKKDEIYIAKRLLGMNTSVEQVAEVTGLPVGEVEKLKELEI